jgi:dipeptidase D
MSAEDALSVVALMLSGPHGVEAMSPDIPGLVQTSTNLGVIDTKDGKVEVNFLTRSSIDASKFALAERIAAACTMAGFGSQLVGGYPGWKPEPDASLVKVVNDVNQELFGKPLEIMAIHAGLECGIIGEKYPGMDMISFGPTLEGVHSPDEKIFVDTVPRYWDFLLGILKNVA